MRKRYILLVLAILAVVAGWSGFWFYAAGEVEKRLDLALEEFARDGMQVVCEDRTVGGYPFRMEVRCKTVVVVLADGSKVANGPLRAVALVYNPRHIIVEADAPLAARLAAVPVDLSGRWNLAQASLIFKGGTVASMAVSLQGVDAAAAGGFGAQKAAAERAELHVRRAPDKPDTTDIAVTLDKGSLAGALFNADPFDAGVLVRLPDGTDWLAGREPPLAIIGMPIEVREAFISRDDARITANGVLTLGADGYFAGDLEVTAAEPGRVAELIRPFYPPDSAIPAAFQGALSGFGKKTTLNGQPAVSAKLTFREGGVRIGFIPIARMVPLF
ncbi:DUF2125 domain-containing protein [Breoghania sp. JC706]|uniref:DUF2125 domain-containing protein n=1 Tax=Breoghania sp. JC706 TaxID=3117732 RepID=UPI00300A9505